MKQTNEHIFWMNSVMSTVEAEENNYEFTYWEWVEP